MAEITCRSAAWRVTVKGVQLVIDAAALEDPKAKNYTPQQLMDLSFLP